MLKYESQKIRQKDKIDSGAQRFNVETLKREKTTGEQSFTIQWMYNTRDYNTSIECISHTGLLESVVTHTPMVPLSLPTVYTRNYNFLYCFSLTLYICPIYIHTLIYHMGYLQIYPPLHIIKIIIAIIIVSRLNNQHSLSTLRESALLSSNGRFLLVDFNTKAHVFRL